jgi:hypothetical protein
MTSFHFNGSAALCEGTNHYFLSFVGIDEKRAVGIPVSCEKEINC